MDIGKVIDTYESWSPVAIMIIAVITVIVGLIDFF